MELEYYIYGTNYLSEMVFDILSVSQIKISGFIDDYTNEKNKFGISIYNYEHLKEVKKNCYIIVAIGDNSSREQVVKKILSDKLRLGNAIDPRAYIGPNVQIGIGNIIFANAYLGTSVKIGNSNIIFPGVSITHHNQVGNYCFFAPNVSVGGGTKIGDRCKFGMNSVVSPYLTVENDFILGATQIHK